MIGLSSKMFITFALLFILFTVPAHEAKAMEPISLAMMAAPIVIPIVKAMMPYIVKGAVNFFGASVDVFVDMAGFALLPFGLFESTIGAPFGLFSYGLKHMGEGALAPFKMMWSMCRVPVRVFTG
jgi:hypothetical protein